MTKTEAVRKEALFLLRRARRLIVSGDKLAGLAVLVEAYKLRAKALRLELANVEREVMFLEGERDDETESADKRSRNRGRLGGFEESFGGNG